jgi:hypothetical protein
MQSNTSAKASEAAGTALDTATGTIYTVHILQKVEKAVLNVT